MYIYMQSQKVPCHLFMPGDIFESLFDDMENFIYMSVHSRNIITTINNFLS